eukprot:364487-Chlamydomonas_euryale.AAC.10
MAAHQPAQVWVSAAHTGTHLKPSSMLSSSSTTSTWLSDAPLSLARTAAACSGVSCDRAGALCSGAWPDASP